MSVIRLDSKSCLKGLFDIGGCEEKPRLESTHLRNGNIFKGESSKGGD